MGNGEIKKIRVMLTITDLSIGGIELVNLNLARHLDKSRFEVTLVCWRGEGPLIERLRGQNFDLVVFGLPPWNFLGILWRYCREIRGRRIHILHANPGSFARISAVALKVPVIISSFHSQWRLGFVKLLLDRILSKFTHYFIGVSQAVAEHTKAQQKIRDDRIKVIYNGIIPEEYELHPRDISLKSELGLAHNARLVGFLGRLSFEKGADILIRAAPAILRKQRTAHLVIVGDGPERADLERMAQELGVFKRVHFLGYRQNIPEILSALHVVAVPSRQAGFELILAEAMASGVAVVASRVGPIPEVIADGETGILVPPQDPEAFADAIIKLMGQPDRRKRMGEAGRARVRERFSIKRMVSETEALYERLVAEKMGGRKSAGFLKTG